MTRFRILLLVGSDSISPLMEPESQGFYNNLTVS